MPTTTRRAPRAPSVNYPRQPPARRHRCPSCRGWTLVGYDASVCALLTTVDLVALDRVGEMLALLAGCRTVALDQGGRLHRRGAREIAGGQPLPVLAVHRCDRVNTGTALGSKAIAQQPAAQLPIIHGPDDTPPF